MGTMEFFGCELSTDNTVIEKPSATNKCPVVVPMYNVFCWLIIDVTSTVIDAEIEIICQFTSNAFDIVSY